MDEFRQAASARAPAKDNRATLTALPTGAAALTLPLLVKAFGDAELVLGPGTEIRAGTSRSTTRAYHFVARHELREEVPPGRVTGDAGEKWGDSFEIEAFPGIAKLMELVLSDRTEGVAGFRPRRRRSRPALPRSRLA